MSTSIPRTMKALHLLRPNPSSPPTLSLADLPVPKPGPGQVLIKVQASAIQPSDLLNAKGLFALTTYPRIPGRDFSGTIVDGPSSLIGKAVYGTSGNAHAFTADGFQAEYSLIPESAIAEKPEALSYIEAATVGVPFTTANMVIERAGAKPGETVLVLGANGAVGKAVVLLALRRGCRVLKGVRGSMGDVDTEGDAQLGRAKELTEGKGPDVVIDTVGQIALMTAAIRVLAKFGRYVTIAAPRQGGTMLEVDVLQLYRDNKSIVGCNSIAYSIGEMAKALNGVKGAFESEEYKAMGASEWQEVPLKDAVEAYGNAGGKRKIVVVME